LSMAINKRQSGSQRDLIRTQATDRLTSPTGQDIKMGTNRGDAFIVPFNCRSLIFYPQTVLQELQLSEPSTRSCVTSGYDGFPSASNSRVLSS
jgi:hypothetical protein